MAQPLAAYNVTYIGTVGTVTLSDRTADVIRLIYPGTYVGTVILHDAVGTAGTNATSPRGTFGIPNTNIAGNIEIGGAFRKGITYMATGTPDLLLVWN